MDTSGEQQFYVGAKTVLQNATVEVQGTAQIDGEFHGELKATHLVVGEEGFVSGTVTSETAEIQGRVEGTATLSGQLTIRASGLLKGKVHYGSLSVDAGARLIGDLATEDGEAGDRPKRESRSKTASSKTESKAESKAEKKAEEERAAASQTTDEV
ncbi:polymer-forming cytoskeletal protein [Amorphus sp. 3PC139-8]|uniref:bactofilin family protein n=1 Tax=Amorphus sp. 3PC139-8 TaxID=2735676 RepID=UPI00345D1AD1